MKSLEERLSAFADEHGVNTKGPLSVMLVLTRSAALKKPPYKDKDFLSPQGGQVAGLGRSAVQAILADYGISRILAEEGGRTSRGSIKRMKYYVRLLNGLAQENMLDFKKIEAWWIDRVQRFFTSQPFRIKIDQSKSLRRIVGELIEAAFARQDECPGTMIAGAVMQHLVGAKLRVALPKSKIEHKGFSVADAPGGRKGDFLVGDTAIHVTTAPTEALIRKCRDNLAKNIRPVIITTDSGAGGAHALARNAEIADRIDILEIEQFVTTNVYEWSGFMQAKRPPKVAELVDEYNKIIDSCETDPSLKISIG
jgi:hypothetical protein